MQRETKLNRTASNRIRKSVRRNAGLKSLGCSQAGNPAVVRVSGVIFFCRKSPVERTAMRKRKKPINPKSHLAKRLIQEQENLRRNLNRLATLHKCCAALSTLPDREIVRFPPIVLQEVTYEESRIRAAHVETWRTIGRLAAQLEALGASAYSGKGRDHSILDYQTVEHYKTAYLTAEIEQH
jgi:hypothetical protein